MNKETVQIWASIAEVVSATAVVVTLAYVVYEFKYSETLQSSEVDVILYERGAEMNQIMLSNPDLLEMIVRVRADPASETAVERMRHVAFDVYFYDSWELAWNYYNVDILGEDAWVDWNLAFSIDTAGRSIDVWQEIAPSYSAGFVEIVNKAHAERGSVFN